MTMPETPSSDGTLRRTACKGGLAALVALAVARPAAAATAADRKDAWPRPDPHGGPNR